MTLLLLALGLIASVASLDEGDSFAIDGTGALQTVTIDSGAEPVTLMIHALGSVPVSTVSLNVKLDESWSGFDASNGDATDYPIIESSLDAAGSPSTDGEHSATLTFNASSSRATQWLSLNGVCTLVGSGDTQSCQADFSLTLSRSELHPSGTVTWKVTAFAETYSQFPGSTLTVITDQ